MVKAKSKKKAIFVSVVLAAVMLFAAALSVHAAAGCGGTIVSVGTANQSGVCGANGGEAGCARGIYLELYACSNGCYQGGYSGYTTKCYGGHTISNTGQVVGYCSK